MKMRLFSCFEALHLQRHLLPVGAELGVGGL